MEPFEPIEPEPESPMWWCNPPKQAAVVWEESQPPQRKIEPPHWEIQPPHWENQPPQREIQPPQTQRFSHHKNRFSHRIGRFSHHIGRFSHRNGRFSHHWEIQGIQPSQWEIQPPQLQIQLALCDSITTICGNEFAASSCCHDEDREL